MKELIENLERLDEGFKAKNATRKLAKIPGFTQKAEQYLAKGNVAGLLMSVRDILGQVSGVIDTLRSFDEGKIEEISKHVDKAYSAANKTYRSLPTKVDTEGGE